MSIFGNILNKILGHHGDVASVAAQVRPATPPTGAPSAPQPAPAAANVDVDAILTKLAADKGQPSNWRESIVDLLKLLDLDSSLESRKALAAELHYSGDTNDSASMNVWLIQQVMAKLRANGGQLPADLRN